MSRSPLPRLTFPPPLCFLRVPPRQPARRGALAHSLSSGEGNRSERARGGPTEPAVEGIPERHRGQGWYGAGGLLASSQAPETNSGVGRGLENAGCPDARIPVARSPVRALAKGEDLRWPGGHARVTYSLPRWHSPSSGPPPPSAPPGQY